MNYLARNLIILWAIAAIALMSILILILILILNDISISDKRSKIDYSDFVQQVMAYKIRKVAIRDDVVLFQLDENILFRSLVPKNSNLLSFLEEYEVEIVAPPKEKDNRTFYFSLLVAIFIGFILYKLKELFELKKRENSSEITSFFLKSKVRMYNHSLTADNVTFADVGGDAKNKVAVIVEFLKDPAKYQKLGGRIPKGYLLLGPTGSGKTLLARAIAGESNVPFFSISGSDFVEMFMGVGASRISDMFNQALKHAPSIIFIDELDAIGVKNNGINNSNDSERTQTLHQLLVELDGFDRNHGVIVIAATNKPGILDPALIRAGRFDIKIVIPNPDIREREEILKIHMRRIPLNPEVQASEIALLTEGFTGADLASLTNHASLIAAEKNKRLVDMAAFIEARNYFLINTTLDNSFFNRSSSEESRAREALYIAGRILVAYHLGEFQANLTVINSLSNFNSVSSIPITTTKSEIENKIAIALAGRAAERHHDNDDSCTLIAESDLKYATELSEKYITQWGFGETLLMRVLANEPTGDKFNASVLPDMHRRIEREITDLLDREFERAITIIKNDQEGLKILIKALLQEDLILSSNSIIAQLLIEGLQNEKADTHEEGV